jgi:hypothetical protein
VNKMSKLQDRQCPFFQKECLIKGCAMYDERLDNCAVHLIIYNLYKLDRTMKDGMADIIPDQGKQFPFPARPQ